MVFASVARFFLGAAGFFLVTAVVVALLIPPYLHVHRIRKKAQKHAILYRPLPEKMPGHVAPSHLEAEVLASFILGASTVVFLVVGERLRSGRASEATRTGDSTRRASYSRGWQSL